MKLTPFILLQSRLVITLDYRNLAKQVYCLSVVLLIIGSMLCDRDSRPIASVVVSLLRVHSIKVRFYELVDHTLCVISVCAAIPIIFGLLCVHKKILKHFYKQTSGYVSIDHPIL